MQLSIVQLSAGPVLDDILSQAGYACIRCGCTIFCICKATAEPGSDAFPLCPDCLRIVRSGGLTAQILARMHAHPIATINGFDRAQFLFPRPNAMPAIIIPDGFRADGVRMTGTVHPIVFRGQSMFSAMLQRPGMPLGLNVALCPREGPLTTVIRNNHWSVGANDGDAWIFARTGSRYEIRHSSGTARLTIIQRPNIGIVLAELETWADGRCLTVGAGGVHIDGERIILPSVHSQLVGAHLA